MSKTEFQLELEFVRCLANPNNRNFKQIEVEIFIKASLPAKYEPPPLTYSARFIVVLSGEADPPLGPVLIGGHIADKTAFLMLMQSVAPPQSKAQFMGIPVGEYSQH